MAAHRRRRWLSFSLRGLLLSFTALAVWLGWWTQSTREQQAAVESIRKYDSSANLWYDNQSLDTSYSGSGASGGGAGFRETGWTPAWVESRLGKDYFHSIESASFGDGARDALNAEDETERFRRTSRLGHLNQLVLNFAVRVESVADIAKLRNLTRLEFSKPCPQLTDEAMRTLSGIRGLQSLSILDALISDAGLAYLVKVPRLKSLALGKAGAISPKQNAFEVTDVGLCQLLALTSLEELELNLAGMTGEGLAYVGTLTKLKRLKLDSPAIDDRALRSLDRLRNLEAFYFVGVPNGETGDRSRGGLQRLIDLRLQGADSGK